MILNLIRRAFAPTTTYFDPTFSAASIGARTNTVPAAVDDMSAEEERLIHLLFDEGILTPYDGFLVAERGAGANMSVDVGSGTAKEDVAILAGSVAGQGKYLVRLDDTVDNLTIEPADASLDRIDEIYVVVQDDAYDSNGSFSLPRLAVRKGDAAASPTAPGPDGSWTAALLLASVDVGASVTSITNADITDERSSATPAVPMVPPGSMSLFGGSAAPPGYLLAQGQAVSRTTYARLFDVIGTTYGIGDGSTTFNLPDLRQRFPLGKAAAGTGSSLGDTGGEIDHDHTNPDVASAGAHTHADGTLATDSEPSHTHTNPTTSSNGAHTHTVSEANGADAGTTTNVDRYNYAVAGSKATHDHTTVSAGAHTHTQGNTGSAGGHSHDVTGATASDGAHQHTQGNTGTNNPPFVVVNYIIKT